MTAEAAKVDVTNLLTTLVPLKAQPVKRAQNPCLDPLAPSTRIPTGVSWLALTQEPSAPLRV